MMKYVLNLGDDGRVLSASFVSEYTPNDAVIVDELPNGNISDYLYIGGKYVHEPLPKPEVEEQPTAEERLEALEMAMLEIMGVAIDD